MVSDVHRRFYRVLAAITALFAPTAATAVAHAEPTASFALISRYIDTPVARFHYNTTGEGSPVVLLPGGTVSLHTYRDMIPALAEHHTVYAVDLPGNGYTTVNDPELQLRPGGDDRFGDQLNRADVPQAWIRRAERVRRGKGGLRLLGAVGLDLGLWHASTEAADGTPGGPLAGGRPADRRRLRSAGGRAG
ncbi:hypothetical protein OIE68_38340 [Nocardia vinacea]|uniref:alpha/beta fold hydrolase n=1 Tax=Nocardia vinacea TaxID=96468 RepID=UPI002E10CD15|nr:hypothetical protein OIE68_38340 [Nocardia vinacea]